MKRFTYRGTAETEVRQMSLLSPLVTDRMQCNTRNDDCTPLPSPLSCGMIPIWGIFIIWLVFALLVGIAASSRGRNGVWWFILAVIISPLIGILFALAMPNLKHEAG